MKIAAATGNDSAPSGISSSAIGGGYTKRSPGAMPACVAGGYGFCPSSTSRADCHSAPWKSKA